MSYNALICIFLFGGLLLLFHFLYLFAKSKATKNWIPIEGKILNSCIQSSYWADSNSHTVKIEYQYTVNNKIYFSKKIFYGDCTSMNSLRYAKKMLGKYVYQKKFIVYYNPYDPRKSVLEARVNPLLYKELFVGIFFVLLSIAMMVEESFFISLFFH